MAATLGSVRSSMPDVIKLSLSCKESMQNEEFISRLQERDYKNNRGIAGGQPRLMGLCLSAFLATGQSDVSVPTQENQDGQQEHDLSMVRRHRAGRREVLCQDVSGQRGGAVIARPVTIPRASRASPDGRVHGDRHSLPRPERRPGFQAQRGVFVSGGDRRPGRNRPPVERDVGNGGQESACGWCKDKWGLSWQITPRALMTRSPIRSRGGQARVRCDDGDGKIDMP